MYRNYYQLNDIDFSSITTNSMFTFFMIALLVIFIIWLIVTIIKIVALAKIFKKAGRPAWTAIIPFYSDYVLLELTGYNWYYIFAYLAAFISVPLSFTPFIGSFLSYAIGLIAFLVNFAIKIKFAKSFKQSAGFAIGLVFIPVVFLPIMAFKNDIKYVGKSVNGDIDFNDLF